MSSFQNTIELLNADLIKSKISPANQSYLSAVDIFDSINSTNVYLLECAKTGAPAGFFCFAEQQTKGRGRLGRVWFSPRGANINCSLLWYFSVNQKNLSALSLMIAVVLCDVLKKYGINEEIQLKWPNDVLIADRKLAGILLESLPQVNNKIPVVIGIGINCQLPKDHPNTENWIDIAEISHQSVARNLLAGLLANELLSQIIIFQNHGFRPFIAKWRQHNFMQDKEIIVKTATETLTGIMQDITEDGELVLRSESDDLQVFQCGEVSIRVKKSS